MPNENAKLVKRQKNLIWSGQMFEPAILAKESELMNKKWFDYRFLDPMKATKQFIRAYKDTFKKHFRESIDHERESNVNGINWKKFYEDPRVRTQIWKARQRADETGMPYDVYVELAFHFALKRDRKMFPQPSQLHFPNAANAHWEKFRAENWKERIDNGLFRVEHPAYRIENFDGLPAQTDYRSFIFDWARSSSRPLYFCIRRYSYDLCQVPEELFRDVITPEVFSNELKVAKSDLANIPPEPRSAPDIHKHELWPSCFGLPHAKNPISIHCATCSFAGACEQIANKVLQKIKDSAGSDNPVLERKRQQMRDRQRRHRAKLAAAKMHLLRPEETHSPASL